jgi:hypothetical protein
MRNFERHCLWGLSLLSPCVSARHAERGTFQTDYERRQHLTENRWPGCCLSLFYFEKALSNRQFFLLTSFTRTHTTIVVVVVLSQLEVLLSLALLCVMIKKVLQCFSCCCCSHFYFSKRGREENNFWLRERRKRFTNDFRLRFYEFSEFIVSTMSFFERWLFRIYSKAHAEVTNKKQTFWVN